MNGFSKDALTLLCQEAGAEVVTECSYSTPWGKFDCDFYPDCKGCEMTRCYRQFVIKFPPVVYLRKATMPK